MHSQVYEGRAHGKQFHRKWRGDGRALRINATSLRLGGVVRERIWRVPAFFRRCAPASPRPATLGALAAAALLMLPTVAARGADFDPLPTFDLSPLSDIFGLPAIGNARLLAPGKRDVRLSAQAANNFFAGTSGSETLLLDGETHRTTLAVDYGTNFGEWGIEVPYLTHS